MDEGARIKRTHTKLELWSECVAVTKTWIIKSHLLRACLSRLGNARVFKDKDACRREKDYRRMEERKV